MCAWRAGGFQINIGETPEGNCTVVVGWQQCYCQHTLAFQCHPWISFFHTTVGHKDKTQLPLFICSLQTVLHACTCFYILYLYALLVKFSACVSLQPTFSHTYDISAAQGLAPYQGLGLRSVTMQTTPVAARSHSSPTCLQMALSAAELPLQTLQHNPGAPQLHPYTSSGQLNSEGQRVQLQGLWLPSFIL